MDKQFALPDTPSPLPEHKEQMVQKFQKEAAVYDGDFQTPYKDRPAALPLGEDPLLVTEVSFSPLADAKLQVLLIERLPGKQRDLQLVMDPALTQGLLRLLNQGLKASGWLGPVPAALLAPTGGAVVPVRSEQELLDAAEEAPSKPRYLN